MSQKPQLNPVLTKMMGRMMGQVRETFSLHMAYDILGHNESLPHIVETTTKITPAAEAWLRENVGAYFHDWSWKDNGFGVAGSRYSFKDENKAILFKLSGLLDGH